MPDGTKAPDDKSANYSFACSAHFMIDPIGKITKRDVSPVVDEVDFLEKDIDTYCQISFTLPDNTKVADDTSGNYSFANSVDFTRDSVDKITLRDEDYPLHKRNFEEEDIDI